MRFFVYLFTVFLSFPVIAADTGTETASSARPAFQEPFTAEAATQLILGLLLVIAVIFCVSWVLKRFPGFVSTSKNMRVIGVLPLTTREKAVLVKVGDTQMLLGVAPGRVTHLHTFAEPVFSDDGEKTGFAERLSEVMQKAKEQKHGD
ncbi:MAG: flagellar biosynthetic protein FliO [Neptuniibacter caesariensis]|uniref:Flagellar protein n=1 Tax=Neptuniibacter caesariensis TaxID=207954 RepID=A0A2G6JMP4_NEPCE|nr:MAG: flagellar biosynthetic protein FliO [Neptuniibacter caesariensis]